MLKYAREDTHYLLYIYDCMRQELLEKVVGGSNPIQYLQAVVRRSTEICLSVYQKPLVKDTNYFMIIGRNKTLNSTSQISALKAILKWRDFVARVDDESPAYMLPNHTMFQICKDLPTTINELRDCCRSQVPPAVMKYQDQLIHLIARQIGKKPKVQQTAAHLNIKFTQATAVAKSANPETSQLQSADLMVLSKSLKENRIKIRVQKGKKGEESRIFTNQKQVG